ncbi:hypothetical protein BC939DRAFT_457541 [Gamsiella multidivaricata]|uniref:uncharacterized protein n=1 Tax=Gamsiella multidivaricata TaxID=101098 RepID=UPI0022209C15|nr:uncharacterized protein BC939DRAFT_457541 [Gamsiella multidivaricata]KAG0363584.1 hypothetical protein BGZ54_008109 [Gamsiella multidivaricata]KAI7820510.1 hypothetical protein BC939DRAFT_457541 [Gamsiella multidivaricata]
MEVNRRPRVVKRQPFLKRIINAPEDYLMRVENNIRAMDWDMLQEGFSWPLALALNFLLISVKLGYWLDDPLANVPAVLRSDRSLYSSKSMFPGFSTALVSLQYILVTISFLNALWLFQSKKNYKMFNRNLDEEPSASHAKMVEIQQDASHWSFKFPGRLVYPFIAPFMKGPKPQEHRRHVWEMSLWNPSILSRNLFCWYSPAQVLILSVMNTDNFYIFFPLSIVVAAQVHFLVSVYQSYVKDKQVLYGEVQQEYNAKFVHPRIFVRKFDKQTSTGTDTDDLNLQLFQQDGGMFRYESKRNPRKFQHLSVPASRFSPSSPAVVSRFRSSSAPGPSISSSELSSSADSESEQNESVDEDEGEEEEEEEEQEYGEDEDMDELDNEDDIENDPDVDYDEEGEQPAVPHPTNALHFDDD